MTIRVVTAAQAAARDAAAIAAGVPSAALMAAAGEGAARWVQARHATRLARGVAVYAGAGNNGGDAWVVAHRLAAAGVPVRALAVRRAATDDAQAAFAAARAAGVLADPPRGDEAVVIDGLLGTGARGAPRGRIADAIATINARGAAGALVVSLDVPSALDASTGAGAADAVRAHATVTFGTLKRGLLRARDVAGTIAVVDIGLGSHAELPDGAPTLVDDTLARVLTPRIGAHAHKGTRGKVLVAGGAPGMTGAVLLAGDGAQRAGAGMTRLVVPAAQVDAVAPARVHLAAPWPADAADAAALVAWTDALVVGPGLGRDAAAATLLARLLTAAPCPVVLDADALWHLAADGALRALVRERPAVLTPHAAEASRLAEGTGVALRGDAEADAEALARALGVTVLLKGVPTHVATPDGEVRVIARGAPTLAVAGSGDLLAGVIGALLAQGMPTPDAAALGAWAHGRAGELAARAAGGVRGVILGDVVRAFPAAWRVPARPPGVLAELPAAGPP
jgi:NAD(P)H-hydrate epimerase